MKTTYSIAFTALLAAMLITGAPSAFAQEGAGIFKSDQGRQIAPQQAWIEDQRLLGEYDEDVTDDWFYDVYSWEEDVAGSEVRGYYGELGETDWYTENNHYTGAFDDTLDENGWFFDTYEDTEGEGFWDF